jgi:oxygen-independent coproporphyrinogen-3 oxidase
VTPPADIGLYIHVPFCKHACPYCDFYKMELRDRPARARLDFPAQVGRELELLLDARAALAQRRLDTIYFGGGTPSTLVPSAVGELVNGMRSRFATAAAAEVTLEANPENLTDSRSAQWRAAGITRLSVGVQSFDAAELKLLERLHEPAAIPRAIAAARAAGFDNISIDLMFALPGQTIETWGDNLRRALELEPDHVSFYGLTYHEHTKFEEWRTAGRLEEVPEDLQADMYLLGAELLEESGFEHYEISNFARPGKRSRHNQRYWSRGDVVGLGPGAHSNLDTRRWRNPDDLDAWARSVAAGESPEVEVETLDPIDEAGERLFTALRRREGIDRAADPVLHGACARWLEDAGHLADGLAECTPDNFRLTRTGWLLSDAIINQVLPGIDL